jgi:hypothetical protein
MMEHDGSDEEGCCGCPHEIEAETDEGAVSKAMMMGVVACVYIENRYGEVVFLYQRTACDVEDEGYDPYEDEGDPYDDDDQYDHV